MISIQVQAPVAGPLMVQLPDEIAQQDATKQKEWILQHETQALLDWLQISPPTAAITESTSTSRTPITEITAETNEENKSMESTQITNRPESRSIDVFQRYQFSLLQRLAHVQQQLSHPDKLIPALQRTAKARHKSPASSSGAPPRSSSLGSFLEQFEQRSNNQLDTTSGAPMGKLLSILLEWTGCHYGLIAKLQPTTTTTVSMSNDQPTNAPPPYAIQHPLCASQRVQILGGTPTTNTTHNDHQSYESSSSDDEDSDNEHDNDNDDGHHNTQAPQPSHQYWPTTTYGPVYYQTFSGSITLMMDQIRFEPVLPLLSTKTRERANEHDDNAYNESNVSLQKSSGLQLPNDDTHRDDGTVELFWNQVAKYQTTKPSSAKHLFRLVVKNSSNNDTHNHQQQQPQDEYVFQMPTRNELERLVMDVKNRTTIHGGENPPTKSKSKSNPNQQPRPEVPPMEPPPSPATPPMSSHHQQQMLRNAQPPRQPHRPPTPQTPSKPQVEQPPRQPTRLPTTPEPSAEKPPPPGMVPPAMPIRKISRGSEAAPGGATTTKTTAPTQPLRRASQLGGPDDEDIGSAADDPKEEVSPEEVPAPAVTPMMECSTSTSLWSVDDLVSYYWTQVSSSPKSCREPMVLGGGTRQGKRRTKKRSDRNNNNNHHGEDEDDRVQEIALLPRAWHSMVVVPVQWRGELQGIVVLAKTKGWDRTNTPLARGGASSSCSGGSHVSSGGGSTSRGGEVDPETVMKQQQEVFAQEHVASWATHVSSICHEFLQHNAWQEQCGAQSQALQDAQQKLHHAVKLHRRMLHSALPAPVLKKLHVDLTQVGGPDAKLQESLTDVSELAGSITSRYGLVVGGNSGGDDCSILTTPSPLTPQKPKIQRSKTSSEADKGKLQIMTRALPRRSASSDDHLLFHPSQQELQAHGKEEVEGGGITRVDSSKRGRPGGLMRREEAEKAELTRIDRSAIPRLNSLRSFNTASVASAQRHGKPKRHSTSSDRASHHDSSGEDSRKSWMSMYSGDASLGLCDLESASAVSDDQAAQTHTSFRTVDSKFGFGNQVSSMDVLASGSERHRIHIQALYAGKNPNVSFVFLSIVNFHETIAQKRPLDVMNILARLFFNLDKLCEKHGAVRLDDATIGGSYIAATGLFGDDDEDKDHHASLQSDGTLDDGSIGTPGRARDRDKAAATSALALAKDMVATANTVALSPASQSGSLVTGSSHHSYGSGRRKDELLDVRIGIHVGETFYGVIGQSLPRLNCITSAVQIAAALQLSTQTNCVCASKDFHDLVGDAERGWEPEHQMVDVTNSAMMASGSIAFTHNESSTATLTMSGGTKAQRSSTASSRTSLAVRDLFGSNKKVIAYTWRSPAAHKLSTLDDASLASSLPSLSNYSAEQDSFAGSLSETVERDDDDDRNSVSDEDQSQSQSTQ